MKPVPWSEVRRLLVCRTDHIGDLVVTTPVLRAFREQLRQAEIWAVVSPPARELAGHWADHVLSPSEVLPEALDAAIGLSPRTSTYALLKRSRARYRVGYVYAERPLARLNCWWNLTHTWTTSLQRGQIPHEAQVVARFAEATGLTGIELRPEFPLPPDLEAWGKQRTGGRVVVHFAPRWLEFWDRPRFFAFLQEVAPVLVTYGPAEAALLGTPPALEGVEWCTGLSLNQWAALLGGARVLLSTDTGAVHIAAARGVSVVVVHLPQHYELCSRQWYPWGVPYRAVIQGEGILGALAELRQREP